MQLFGSILKMIDDVDFKSDYLLELKNELVAGNRSATRNIDRLANIINGLDQRLNFIAAVLLNGLLLWDVQYIMMLERWQSKFKNELPKWFRVISEFDAISSLACFSYNNR